MWPCCFQEMTIRYGDALADGLLLPYLVAGHERGVPIPDGVLGRGQILYMLHHTIASAAKRAFGFPFSSFFLLSALAQSCLDGLWHSRSCRTCIAWEVLELLRGRSIVQFYCVA